MQPLTWYARRLAVMSPGEVTSRVRASLRDTVDQCLVAKRARPKPLSAITNGNGVGDQSGFRVSDVKPGEWSDPSSSEQAWYRSLITQAERVAAHQLSFFDLHDRDLGDPIDWNRDHKHGKAAPLRFAPSIDYRDFGVTGDCKFVWEPNRHHQLVVLGRACRASGERRFAAAIVEQLESWMAQCPFGVGMNWRSPLELGIRLINWVWAVDLIRESGVVSGDFRVRLLNAVYRHAWEITRKYSRGSSSNNHLIGEAAGVYIATSYFRHLRQAERWRQQSRAILCDEILAQTYPDGGPREQASGYHLFVLQLFLLAGLVARWAGDELPAVYWARLEKMFEFVAGLCEGGDSMPMLGDCDDGYVLDLGGPRSDARARLCVGAVLFERSDFKALAGQYSEPCRWLLGRKSATWLAQIPQEPDETPISSRAFPDAGYYLLQCGQRHAGDRISVLFDCGDLGYGPLAAHGHADALSFTLRAFGVDVLVDPGTYDYFSHPDWRRYFRGTRAHNTVCVDGHDQSEMLGPFLWGTRAHSRCTRWEPTGQGGSVTGEHDGYTRLADPVRHERSLELDGPKRELHIQDRIRARDTHEIELRLHLAESCRVIDVSESSFLIDAGPGQVRINLDPRLNISVLTASENPIGGWVSRGYHCRAPSTTLVGTCRVTGEAAFSMHITIVDSGV